MAHVALRPLLAIFFLTLGLLSKGQTPSQGSGPDIGPKVAFHITDLTSEERDALARALGQRGDARLAFACVPAGILIIESTEEGRSADSLRLRALPGLLAHVQPSRIQEEHLTLAHAESLCADSRSH